MKDPASMKQTLDLISLKPPYILLTIIIFVIPLWVLDWGPLTVKLSKGYLKQSINKPDHKPSISITPLYTLNTAPQLPATQKVIISPGDTLMTIFARAGLSRPVAYRAILSLSKLYNPKNILPGQEVEFIFKPPSKLEPRSSTNIKAKLTNITFRPNLYHEYTIALDQTDRFSTTLYKQSIKTKHIRVKGHILSSLYLAAIKSGLPVSIVMELIRIYSWDIDFQRSIRSGDQFELLYERKVTESGNLARYGNILYANIKLGNLSNPLYFFKTKSGSTDFFDHKGHSARKALMKTPINGARLSSGYGTRRHPILGFNKMHRGVDFAAPRGTPIFAAGSGTIIYRSRNGSYGNYIRIRHNSKYSTAYGHLSKFSRYVAKGSRVRQGQIIGYVGTTGRSTGAHLHYEILSRGRQINPMRVKMPSGKRLRGEDFEIFKKAKTKIMTIFSESTPKADLAYIVN